MKALLLLAVGALTAGAAAPSSSLPLQALTEADVGADALASSACYVHAGSAVLLVATRKNAVVNSDGDLLMLERSGGGGFPGPGARYRGNNFEVVITPGDNETAVGGRTDRAAQVSVRTDGKTRSVGARWSCAPPA
ncbi:MAG: hypothetical protein QOJ91_1526 [Sphingomonadales bacterium]|jgi:hypothetical protein|nr:hypothetical protein [Sphingomonadales bacterium]